MKSLMDKQWPKAVHVNGLFKECMQLDRLEREHRLWYHGR